MRNTARESRTFLRPGSTVCLMAEKSVLRVIPSPSRNTIICTSNMLRFLHCVRDIPEPLLPVYCPKDENTCTKHTVFVHGKSDADKVGQILISCSVIVSRMAFAYTCIIRLELVAQQAQFQLVNSANTPGELTISYSCPYYQSLINGAF